MSIPAMPIARRGQVARPQSGSTPGGVFFFTGRECILACVESSAGFTPPSPQGILPHFVQWATAERPARVLRARSRSQVLAKGIAHGAAKQIPNPKNRERDACQREKDGARGRRG